MLFTILSAEVVLHLPTRASAAVIGLFFPLTVLPLSINTSMPMAVALGVLYLSANALLAAYSTTSRRARAARDQNQAARRDLQAANLQLEDYSHRVEQLAAVRERSRMARELHDSVTQSIFSLTLTAQSAMLLLQRGNASGITRVDEQLARMEELTQGAMAEMQLLISELNPQRLTAGGLATALRRHLAERQLPETLTVHFEVEGDQRLSPAEDQGLFRIVQESLNNIVKHSSAIRVELRLCLTEAPTLEVKDNGQGFNPAQAESGRGMGLSGMRERAAEIGWSLQVVSAPGAGTCIRAEKKPGAVAAPRSKEGYSG